MHLTSREAAQDRSPRRKPWGKEGTRPRPAWVPHTQMIKSIHAHAIVRTREDFDLLVRLIDCLGLHKDLSGEDENRRYVEYDPTWLRFDVVESKRKPDDPDLGLTVSDPDSAFEALQKAAFKDVRDVSHPVQEPWRVFDVHLPGGTRVRIVGRRVMTAIHDEHVGLEGSLNASGKRFGLVVSRFNSFITERLLEGTLNTLFRCGAGFENYTIVRVPGAFEIPSAARTLAETGKYDAIICLGCLLRGDTAHYDVIVNEVTRGIGQSAQETGVPHAFGVLTCDTLEQAIDRAGLKMGNKGFEAALAAVEMANLKKAVSTQHSAFSKDRQARSSQSSNSKKSRKSTSAGKKRRP